MRVLCLITFLFVAGAIPASADVTTATLDRLIQQCIDNQFLGTEDVRRDTELRIEKSCPHLARALEQAVRKDDARLTNITPPPRSKLTLAQLLDIRYGLNSFQTDPNRQGRAVDHELLDGIIKDTYLPFEETPEELTLFERFNNWVNSLWERVAPDDPSPFFDWLEGTGIAEWPWEAIFQVTVVLLILFALYVIFNELRAGSADGLLRRVGYRALNIFRKRDEESSQGDFNWSRLNTLSPRQRIIALLRYELAMLVKRRQLSGERSRTNREISNQLREKHSAYSAGFGELTPTADRALYSQHDLTESESGRAEEIVRTAERGESET